MIAEYSEGNRLKRGKAVPEERTYRTGYGSLEQSTFLIHSFIHLF